MSNQQPQQKSLIERAKFGELADNLKEIMGVIRDFYNDDNLDQKTQLDYGLASSFTKLEFRDDLLKREFGYKSNMTEKIKNRMERKFVSIGERKGSGRTEAMNVLGVQLSNILMHPQTALKRMLGE